MADSVIQAVVGKVVEYSVDAIKNQVRYLCCYSCNVQKLADEVEELNVKYQSLQLRVNESLANSEVIMPDVEAWLNKVENLKTRSDKIRDDAEQVKRRNSCLCKHSWFPMMHYFLSRKAFKTTNDCVQIQNIEFSNISTHVIPADLPCIPMSTNVRFESRVSIEDKIVIALKDPSVYSIGIWGIGGVGKTVMAKTIEKRVRDEKLFERVIMVIVSQQPDIPKIQSHIAKELGLVFMGDSSITQQKELYWRFMAEKGILIIFDDVWEKLDLEELGIPSQGIDTRCKLILTSRNHDALTSTNISLQNIFQLQILTEQESWKFFTDNADIHVDDDSHYELVQIAKKVERKCKGLPLALKIVACALKGKGLSFWNNALRELEKRVPDNIPSVTKNVYGSLLFSINALEGKEQKDLFLLCCLFLEDYFISMEELLRYGIGLGIFMELENLIEARDKVETVLNILASRSLLIIEGEAKRGEFNVRMHDVIRDVGIWIATKGIDKHKFLTKHGVNEWPTVHDDSFNNYTCISLLFSHHSISFPESIAFPKLELLRLDFVDRRFENYYVVLPEKFFSGMGGLRVLEALHIRLLPPSMSQLNNLRTLSLQQCRILDTVSMLGKLINLEMLTLRNCDFEVLPKEIGDLKHLKQINILQCAYLRRIAYGVVSGLSRLEELVILGSFGNWVAKNRGKDVACLSELNSLKNLTSLKIEIRNPSVVPTKKPLWIQKVKTYAIIVSRYSFYNDEGKFQKSIVLGDGVVNLMGDWIFDMASDAEYVKLVGSNCMKFVKGLSENFESNKRCLKKLSLSQFTNIQYLVQGLQDNAIFPMLESLCIENSNSLQEICEVSPPSGSLKALQSMKLRNLEGLVCLWKFSIKEQLYLGNLQNIKIYYCDNLSYLFSLSIAQSLAKLTNLTVSNCRIIKEIFKNENNGEIFEIGKIILPKLKEIEFSSLDSFYRLCSDINGIELPELCSFNLYHLPRVNIAEGDDNNVHQEYLIPKVAGINSNFFMLQRLAVKSVGSFKCMFYPSIIINGLPNLWWLQIEDCSMVEEVIGKDDGKVKRAIIFPNLNYLTLSHLPNIRTFCYNAIQFPSLKRLEVRYCPLMLQFVEELDNPISNSRPFLDEQVECPKLMNLFIDSLNISKAFSSLFFKSLTMLEDLSIRYCEGLECLITKEEEEGGEGQDQFTQKISLKNFDLISLPKLHGSVFQIKHSLKFPFLEVIEILNCPMLKKFSLGSLHLPNLKRVIGFFDSKFAANFFFHNEMSSEEICSNNNCFIISIKDISFNFDVDLQDSASHFLAPHSSIRFRDAIKIPYKKEIVGRFKIEEIREGIEYEVMLMIMILKGYGWEVPIEIELKLPQGTKLQRTEILGHQKFDTWIAISIGKFVGEPQQEGEEFEFSLHVTKIDPKRRRLCIKGIRIIQL